ncbi:nucleoside-diphosphate sugar epimerase/dehydratase [Nocardioides caricicola]|uniref:Nucleoside-diphosphate sugar epimerase/dehydratase n=1 Tax=Nocardioides caricicola TaxID=634770 RepID=A0ABW0MV89_9ACTN
MAIAFDVGAWLLAYVVFAWLRLDSDASAVPWSSVVAVAAINAGLYVALAIPFKLHHGRARTASLEEMVLLGMLMGGSGFAVFLVNLVTHWVPRSIPAGATFGALVLAAWARAMWRTLQERDERSGIGSADNAQRALVVGAGEAARELISSMQRDPQRRYHPVGLLDDDPRKRHLRIRHVSVLGGTCDLAEQVALVRADVVVIAIPSASAETVNRLRLAAIAADVPVKVLPSSTQLLNDSVGIRDLRDINITDVLGRNQLDTDVAAIADYLTGQKVLVTGAGGSIGSELCRQIFRYEPAELMMLDRDESALHAVQLSIHGRALLDSDDVILCDIRDEAAVRNVFATRRPDVVFHAAALKHLPMLEQYPAEAVKTNILGTRNVIDAADLVGVDKFVNISTDKAANPVSVLGWSKRVAERLTADRARTAEGDYLSVRFGNVLGSRGSVLASFARQIAQGGPLTVTDPEVTRFFMTIEEACQLVIQAAAIGAPGEALVLDMGEPVRIVDVAKQLMEQSGTPVRIEYTGLREGEKLHEDLFADDEPRDIRPRHPLVSHVPVPPVGDAEVLALPTSGSPEDVRRALRQLSGAAVVPVHGPDAAARRL